MLVTDGARKQARREVLQGNPVGVAIDNIGVAVESKAQAILAAAHPSSQTIADFGRSYELSFYVDNPAVRRVCNAVMLCLPVCHLKAVLTTLRDRFVSEQSALYRFPEYMKVSY